MTELCYVIDINGNKLSPTNYNKGWILLRKKKAKLISRLPFVIKLLRKQENTDCSFIICGIDNGSKFTGIGLVSECQTKNKVLFKGTINHRQDVSKLMDLRTGQRRYRRSYKRYRKARFNNRASSKRKGRIPPSIKTHKDEILRVINKLSQWICIDKVIIEDVQIDIRRLTDDKKLYKWQYQKSNRLDENLRKATIIRDDNTCQMCGIKNGKIEVHHITPKRLKGMDSLKNLISLCATCHKKVTGKEMEHAEMLYSKINGKNTRFDYSQRCMQGKTYLRDELSKKYIVELTYGSDTANKRIGWNIEKSHGNDAIVITGLKISQKDCDIKDWYIQPLRTKKQQTIKLHSLNGLKHRDIISYTKRDGEIYIGYIIGFVEKRNFVSFQGIEEKYSGYSVKRCKLIQRNKSINFI